MHQEKEKARLSLYLVNDELTELFSTQRVDGASPRVGTHPYMCFGARGVPAVQLVLSRDETESNPKGLHTK